MNILMEQLKKSPVPVLYGDSQFRPGPSNPANIPLDRRTILAVMESIIRQCVPILPPRQAGTFAAGALTLTFAAGIIYPFMAIKFKTDAGDQVSLSTIAGTVTTQDEAGQAVVDNFVFQTGKSAEGVFIPSMQVANIGLPIPIMNGQMVITNVVGPVATATTTVIAMTGPTGLNMEAELIGPTHDWFQEIVHGDLYERLIRYKLGER